MSHKPDFPPSRLKTGSGVHCLWVLDHLANEALKKSNFSWKKPSYPQEESNETQVLDDDDNEEDLLIRDNDNENFEDMGNSEDEEADEVLFELNDLTLSKDNINNSENKFALNKYKNKNESDIDLNEWKLEVERVIPQLKITLRPDNKDWRVHFDLLKQNKNSIITPIENTKLNLMRISKDIKKNIDKLETREGYLNDQLKEKIEELRVKQNALEEVRAQYKESSVGISERSKTLSEITDDLERLKQDMEEKGSSMSDGTPLIKIKQSINQLKNEMIQMDVRIGVLQHILLRAKIKEKSLNNTIFVSKQEEDDDEEEEEEEEDEEEGDGVWKV